MQPPSTTDPDGVLDVRKNHVKVNSALGSSSKSVLVADSSTSTAANLSRKPQAAVLSYSAKPKYLANSHQVKNHSSELETEKAAKYAATAQRRNRIQQEILEQELRVQERQKIQKTSLKVREDQARQEAERLGHTSKVRELERIARLQKLKDETERMKKVRYLISYLIDQ